MEIRNCRVNPSTPDDVIEQIFLRLPLKSLLRFRCVTKTWCDRTDSVYFANMHLTMEAASAAAAEEPQILALPLRKEPSEILNSLKYEGNIINDSKYPILEFSSDGRFDLVCQPAYGLLCFRSRGGEIFLCNPLRGEVLKLPHSTSTKSSIGTENYGMGFDSLTSTYKIVRVFSEDKPPPAFIQTATEVYRFDTRSWRRIFSVPPSFLNPRGVSAYGDMHWMNENYKRSPDNRSASPGMIITFDFRKEEFKWTPHPNIEGSFFEKFMLVNLKGSLAMIKFSSASIPNHMEIWVLKDYDKKDWVRQYRISVQEWIRPSYSKLPHLYLWKYLEEPLTGCAYSSHICLYLLDLRRNCICHIQSPQPKGRTYKRMILDYTGSILSLKNFGNSFSVMEDPIFDFVKTARMVYITA